MNKKLYRDFTVRKGLIGWKVEIGCEEAYFDNNEKLIDTIEDYIHDPQGAEKRYREQDMRGSLQRPTRNELMRGIGLRPTAEDFEPTQESIYDREKCND